MSRRGVIVTGTDTGVGKTIFAAMLLAALRARDPDLRLLYWKPFQTGSDDDTATVAKLAGLSASEIAVPAARLRLPASPLEAALAEGVTIEVPDAVPAGDDAFVVVEGAGGLLVPIAPGVTMAEAFARWGLPLIVVARPEVGTINHTLLTLSEAQRRGLEVLAVVVPGDPTAFLRDALSGGGTTPAVVVPRLLNPSPESIREAAQAALVDPAYSRLVDSVLGQGGASAPPSDLIARDSASLWHPYTQHGIGREPLPVVSARGSWLTLADGRRVLDGISSWWTTLFGHGHPAIANAIARQARVLDHVGFGGATHEPAVRLAERLLALAPPGLERVFYSDDGSTAVECALKMAVQFQARRGHGGRTRFLSLEHGYHGDTVGAMSVSAQSPFTAAFRPLLFDSVRIPIPSRGRKEAECLAALDRVLDEERDVFAAMIVEPLLMGAGGMCVTTRSFLQGLRERCKRRGVLFIADEVFTGFGRTGAMFACGRAGITPDLLCVSKALTGGTLPLAATLATGAIFSAFLSEESGDAFLHGHSYTANPIACAAALATLDLLDAKALDRGVEIGERLAAGLSALKARRGVADIRGIGPMRAVELSDPDHRGYLSSAGPTMAAAALERGVWLRPLGNVLYALPPLGTTDAEVDQIASAMVAAVESVLPA